MTPAELPPAACVGVEAVLPTAPGAADCAALAVETGARLGLTLPDPGVGTTIGLPRTRVEGGLARGPGRGRVGLGFARSGGEEGYIGIDGEAIVPVLRVAEATVGIDRWGLSLSAGALETAWVTTGDARWTLPSLAPTLGDQAGWLDTADLGGALTWAAPKGWVAARAELFAGEGVSGRERNDGKNLGGLVELRPLAGAGRPEALRLAVYARDGSRGLSSVRDDRLGARVDLHLPSVDAGVEGLAAWGVGGDAERAPLGAAGWLAVRPWGPLLTAARVDAWSESPGTPDASTWVLVGALGAEVPVPGLGRALVAARAERVHTGGAVAAIAGDTALTSSTTIALQVGTTLAWSRSEPP